jgi:cobaltochelatase CobS
MTTKSFIDLSAFSPKLTGKFPWERQAGGEEKIPKIKPNYYVDPERAKALLLWLGMDMPLWLYGPHGAGKTSLIRQMAAVFGQPVLFDNGDPEAEKSDFNAVMGVAEGNTCTVYSALAQAIKNGWWYVLNEADLIRPGVLTSLNTLLDDSECIVIPHSGEVITPAPGFRLIVTANSVGRGDITGKHQVFRQNRALMDRFFKMSVDYAPPAIEKEILLAHFPLPKQYETVPEMWDAVLDSYIQFANMVRSAHKGEEIEVNGRKELYSLSETLSTRSLVLWIEVNLKTKGRIPFKDSINYLLALDAPEAAVDRDIISVLGRTVFGQIWESGVQQAAA